MFTTFHGTSPHDDAAAKDAAPAGRPKRTQVHRACDWCKLMRTKCDSHRPCIGCKQAGRECVTNGQNHFRSVAAAAKYAAALCTATAAGGSRLTSLPREVERLRKRVRELEGQPASPAAAAACAGRRASLDRVSAARNFYALASLPVFLNRMSLFLESALQQPQLDLRIAAVPAPRRDFLRRAQEEHVLDLFWQTHYFSHPIVHEADFRTAFQALWADCGPDGPRPASPLVDIVLALCMQLGTSSIHHTSAQAGPPPPDPCYATPAGFQYFQRCQAAIGETVETPSLTTVQCYIFSIVYLREAGLLNRAQVMAGAAIMMAIILGLHEEPQPDGPGPQKEMARRTWWSLYILDAQLAMDVGRPSIIDSLHSTCRRPSDALEVAQSLGPHYVFDDSCTTWLGFQSQTLSLLDTIRTILATFYEKCDTLCGGGGGFDGFYADGAAREKCARFLTEQMRELAGWAKQVPDGYRMPRRAGTAFSTDRSSLDLSHDVPIHWQRQRLLLELQYHQYSLSLYRPFICFTPTPEISTPLCDSKATASLNHAITLTNIVHQALTASEALNGVNQVFYWQKSALFTMLGFAYTFPVSHSVVATRKAIDTAIAVVDMYRDILPEASRVAATARNLAENVSAIISGFRTGSGPIDITRASLTDGSGPSTPPPLTAREGFAGLASIADEPFDMHFLQKEGGDTDWGDMDALWASLEQGGAGGFESWMTLEEAFAFKGSEDETA